MLTVIFTLILLACVVIRCQDVMVNTNLRAGLHARSRIVLSIINGLHHNLNELAILRLADILSTVVRKRLLVGVNLPYCEMINVFLSYW